MSYTQAYIILGFGLRILTRCIACVCNINQHEEIIETFSWLWWYSYRIINISFSMNYLLFIFASSLSLSFWLLLHTPFRLEDSGSSFSISLPPPRASVASRLQWWWDRLTLERQNSIRLKREPLDHYQIGNLSNSAVAELHYISHARGLFWLRQNPLWHRYIHTHIYVFCTSFMQAPATSDNIFGHAFLRLYSQPVERLVICHCYVFSSYSGL